MCLHERKLIRQWQTQNMKSRVTQKSNFLSPNGHPCLGVEKVYVGYDEISCCLFSKKTFTQ